MTNHLNKAFSSRLTHLHPLHLTTVHNLGSLYVIGPLSLYCELLPLKKRHIIYIQISISIQQNYSETIFGNTKTYNLCLEKEKIAQQWEESPTVYFYCCKFAVNIYGSNIWWNSLPSSSYKMICNILVAW
jgi:hypothetical protein